MKYIKSKFFKWLFCFVLGGALVFTGYWIDQRSEIISNFEQYFTSMLLWVDGLGTMGAIAFVVIYATATIVCIPGSILALCGGALFGIFWGAVVVFLGGFIGAVSAFCLGRYLLNNWAKRQLIKNRYLRAINRAIASEGWKFASLLHLSPIIPFNMLNYALGASKLALNDFIVATAIGIIPGVVLYTLIGSTFGDLTMVFMGLSSKSHGKIQLIFSIAGLLITLILIVYFGRLAQNELRKKLD